MRNWIIGLFASGWVIILFGACQLDSIDPQPVALQDMKSGKAFYHSFILNMDVNGPDSYVTPYNSDEPTDDPGDARNLTCIGESEIDGIGTSATTSGTYTARTVFTFDPLTCRCGGELRIEYESPNYLYVFNIEGVGHLEQSITTSETIEIPLDLEFCTGPNSGGTFVGYLYIEQPAFLAKAQDQEVSTRAFVKGVFYPPFNG